MVALTTRCHHITDHTHDTTYNTDIESLIVQIVSLFNMGFQIALHIRKLPLASHNFVHRMPVNGQCVSESQLFWIHQTCNCSASKRTSNRIGFLCVKAIDFNRMFQLFSLIHKAFYYCKTRRNTISSVKESSVWHGIHVGTDQDAFCT